MPSASLSLGELRPDDAPHASAGLIQADGVYQGANAFRPIKAFSKIADALSGTFLGGGAFISTSGSTRLIAGDGSALYSLSGGSWTSKLGSLSVNDRWRFTQFGDHIICTFGGAPVDYDLTGDTAANLTGSPPSATFCATVGDFVVLGRAEGVNNEVWWSGQGDHTVWTAGTEQSGEQPIYAGGKIMGLTSGEICYIIQRFQVTRMSYTGDATDPFEFHAISTNDGCAAEGSLVQIGSLVFWWSDHGFRMFDGAQIQPIGTERIDTTFDDAYSTTDLSNLWATADPVRNIVVWVIQGRQWIYNWVLNRWTTAALPVYAAFPSFTSGVSIDALDAIYGDLDSIPYSLDDPRFQGGDPRMTVVNLDGDFGVLSGSNVAATFELPFLELAPGREARIQRAEPVTDATGGITLTSDVRRRLGNGESLSAVTALNDSGYFFPRVAGRHWKPKLEIAAGTDWTYIQALDVEYAIGGRA